MVVYKFDDFINEAKIADLQKIGTRVIFASNLNQFESDDIEFLKKYYGGQQKINLHKCGDKFIPLNIYEKIQIKNKTATLKKVEKITGWGSHLTFELDEPVEISQYYHRSKKIKLNKITLNGYYSLRNIEILTAEHQERLKKIESGLVVKYRATQTFNIILKAMKFKKDGEFFDWTYFDIVKDKPEYVSFVPAKKSNDNEFEKFRQETKVGRVLRKLNPNLKDAEIETFVDKYRAELESYFSTPDVHVVVGEDIVYWYDQKHYKKAGGTLNNSCMAWSGNPAINFYANFPEQIALATYRKGEELYARALIWRLDDGRVYMDRIYSVNGAASLQLEKYGRQQNMVLRKDGGRKGIEITLKDGKKYKGSTPYFDTFYVDTYYKHEKDLKLKAY